MIEQQQFFECLNDIGIKFVTGVPDSCLYEFCLYAETELPQEQHVIAASEGNAVALAAGYHLATGSVPLVYMQNSGLSNAMNPLLSLTNKDVYAIPMVLLIGWRGEPGTTDWAQHKKVGQLTTSLLQSMDIPFRIIGNDSDVIDAAKWATRTAQEMSGPTALLVRRGAFGGNKKEDNVLREEKYNMSRERAIACVIKSTPKNTIFVATTGRTTRELYKLRNEIGEGHGVDFLNVGAMGHASSIATGIALAKKNNLVVCLDGDGAAIMHLGALTTIGMIGPSNLLHVVLNNGAHESVGGQPTAGFSTNLTAIAENAGYKTVGKAVESEPILQDTIKTLLTSRGPAFIDVRLRKGSGKGPPPLQVFHQDLKDAFMKAIG